MVPKVREKLKRVFTTEATEDLTACAEVTEFFC
jgi:hypothetical protein